MSTILGIIRRAKNRKQVTEFYKLLGLNLNEHQHGGPVHAEVRPIDPKFVLEVYQQSPRYTTDVVMVGVEDLRVTLLTLQQNGVDVPQMTEKNFVYVKDPDGSDVMLVQL